MEQETMEAYMAIIVSLPAVQKLSGMKFTLSFTLCEWVMFYAEKKITPTKDINSRDCMYLSFSFHDLMANLFSRENGTRGWIS